MTKVNKNLELKKYINDYCKAKKISKNELATQIGVNGAYLSKIETEKFDDIADEMLNKIRSAITRLTVDDVLETTDLASVFALCDKTRKYRLMTGLTADTGMGKTTALKRYSFRQNVFYVTVGKAMTAKRLLVSILRAMNVSFDGSIHDIVVRIADELNRLENPLLIIDEAGKLTHNMLLYLHDLREYTLTNCGVILSGMPYFRMNLQKAADCQREGCAEFLRRINLWHKMSGLSKSEIDLVCHHNGIQSQKSWYGLRFADLMNQILLEKIKNEND